MLRGHDSLLSPGFASGTRTGAPSGATAVLTAGAYRWLVGGYCALLAVLVLRGVALQPFADAYFFKCFALNFLADGEFLRSASDGPILRGQSPVFQLLVTALTWLTRTYTVLAVRTLLAITLAFGFTISLRTSARRGALVATTLGYCSPVILFSALSGIETAVVFLLLSSLCAVLDPEAESPWYLAPLLVGLSWLTRPDAGLLALPVFVGMCWLRFRHIPIRQLVGLAALLGLCALAFRGCYGVTPALLSPSAAPASQLYEARVLEFSSHAGWTRLSVWMWAALPLVLIASSRFDAINQLLVGSVVFFLIVRACAGGDVMGMHARSFAPALPVLIYAASRAERRRWKPRRALWSIGALVLGTLLLMAARGLPIGSLDNVENFTRAHYVLGTVAALAAVALPRKGTLGFAIAASSVALGMIASVASLRPLHFGPRSDADYAQTDERQRFSARGVETLQACYGAAWPRDPSALGERQRTP